MSEVAVVLLRITQPCFPKLVFAAAAAAEFAAGTSFPRQLGCRSHSNTQRNEYRGCSHPPAQMQQCITVCIS